MKKKDKLSAIIVDDEQLAREDFKRLITNIDEVEIIEEAASLEEAVNKCTALKPDIVFLDIQLTRDSGFDLIEHLEPATKTVFVTAFDEYAIKAFEVSACDYLLKPLTLERLKHTIDKIVSEDDQKLQQQEKPISFDESIFLRLDNSYQFVKISLVKFISSADDYSVINIEGQKKGKLSSKTLREWEQRLPENHFCRIHRYTIINVNYIDKIEPWHNSSYRVYIKGEVKPLLMSRRYFSVIKSKLG